MASSVFFMRWSLLPRVDQYRVDIEQALSHSLKLPVRIDQISAHWDGLRPHLAIAGLQILDGEGRPALRLDRVEADVAWLSIPTLSLQLARLEITGPALSIRREQDGRLFVAGVAVSQNSQGSDVSDWVLSQSSIVIRNASIDWVDAARGAPPLQLRGVNFRLDNSGERHRFGLQAAPPTGLAGRLDVRGDLRGRDLAKLANWRGELFAQLDQADLGGWRAWVDYPDWMPHGTGSLRLWARLADRQVTSMTADMALRDVTVRMSPALPLLDLAHMSGRVQVGRPAKSGGEYEVAAQRLVVAMRDGVTIAPVDFSARWKPSGSGSFSASTVDFTALNRLAAHVPLPQGARDGLARFEPRGVLSDVKLTWSEAGASFGVRAKFAGLGVSAFETIPGVEGLTGSVEANEHGGALELASRAAALHLPAVFPEPRIALDELSALAHWTVAAEGVDVVIDQAAFANQDAAGRLSGRWTGRSGQRGNIDLSAQLDRGNATAVWKYLPKTVGPETRGWVKDALLAGRARDTRVRLKGALNQFPFEAPGSGVFQVTSNLSDVTLDYARGWPVAEDVAGELLFEGKRMLVRAKSGRILDAALSGVTAEIPDLLHHEEVLMVAGQAAGATQTFLDYVSRSPLSTRVGEFIRGAKASGQGALELKLVLPLRHLVDASVAGQYQFKGNRVALGAQVPVMTDAGARLVFSEKQFEVRNGVANIFGSPVTISAATQEDGALLTRASGRWAVADMRRATGEPIFDALAGSSSWQAQVRIARGAVSATLESGLQGISSALPSPFNKSANEVMPLRVELAPLPAVAGVASDQVRGSLGKVMNLLLVRRYEDGGAVVERGAIGIGESPALPERGVLLAANVKSFNANAWRRLMGEPKAGLPVTSVSARAGVAVLGGQVFNDVSVQANLTESTWNARVASREAMGEVSYRTGGKGRVVARLKQLYLSELRGEGGAVAANEVPVELPALDVVADNFRLGGHALGKLEVQAVNRASVWRMERFAIINPDGVITGDGQWRSQPQPGRATEPATQINVKVDSGNIGRLLERVGYADTMRRGSGKLEARLSWAGGPTAIDYPTLAGDVKVEVENGQFAKLEPGVGRLLGVVSLQSLPRRITLDFRDVFSDGFAFDSISGTMKVQRGVMATDGLQIRGPAARVTFKGSVDLAQETQNLQVKVQPTLSESVAIGAAIANPLAGVATFIAQKVLRDPFEKIFAFEYAVTGTWTDPKVEKLQGPLGSQTAPPELTPNPK